MALVGKIQGTARVINYAGLVRGETQRMIKLENAGYPQDRMSETIHSYIKGLREGSDELNFVRLDDAEFQDKMKELDDYFQILKEEVSLVREKGYQQTNIIEKSEKFFKICDKAVGRAEVYSQRLGIRFGSSGEDRDRGYRRSADPDRYGADQGGALCRAEPDFAE